METPKRRPTMRIPLLLASIVGLLIGGPATLASAQEPCVLGVVCVPETEPVDACVANPQSCVEETTETVQGCAADPGGCVTAGDPEPEPQPQSEAPGETDRSGSSVPPARSPGDTDKPRGASDDGAPRRERHDRSEKPASERAPRPVASRVDAPHPGALRGGSPRPEGVLERVGRAVVDSSSDFAIPFAIMALAGLFLLFQGRIDRRDPKLVLAPLDAADDLLTFA